MGRIEQVKGRELQSFGSFEEGQKHRQGVVDNKIEEIAYLQICMAF